LSTLTLLALFVLLAAAPGVFGVWVTLLRGESRAGQIRQQPAVPPLAGGADYPSVEAWRSMLVPDGAPIGTPAETALIPGKSVR
jgi:hypothetical protein